MRIVVACSFVPFSMGDSRQAAERVVGALRDRGDEAEVSALPVDSESAEGLEQQLALRLLDVSSAANRLVCLGLPAALLRHPDKRVWLDQGFDVLPRRLARAQLARTFSVALAEAQLLALTRGDARAALARQLALEAHVLDRPRSAAEWAVVAAELGGR